MVRERAHENSWPLFIKKMMAFKMDIVIVRKRAKIRKQYNQASHLTQDTKGKVATSQLYITNDSQVVSPFPASDHQASINRCGQKHNKNINNPQKRHRLGTVSKNIFYLRA